ncbi:hypothetical protein N1851_021736 [Merluccius polli]|uniref:Uncharacterized protein n=1 Tax=Merluccius polli TaxID=89951 RepID=A0AA47MJ19_MERPO|nr:hypothetical protein N1851_021736 [Merluccius polli]
MFHNVPARREDYITVPKSSVFPLSFCVHRWVENLPVVERALADQANYVTLTKKLLASVSAARARYRVHLDTERKKREAEAQALKRKRAEDQHQELRGKRRRLQEVSEGLARDADRLAEEAEGKAGSKMADLITRSNLLRRGHKEKLAELAVLDKEIAAKSAELRS